MVYEFSWIVTDNFKFVWQPGHLIFIVIHNHVTGYNITTYFAFIMHLCNNRTIAITS